MWHKLRYIHITKQEKEVEINSTDYPLGMRQKKPHKFLWAVLFSICFPRNKKENEHIFFKGMTSCTVLKDCVALIKEKPEKKLNIIPVSSFTFNPVFHNEAFNTLKDFIVRLALSLFYSYSFYLLI